MEQAEPAGGFPVRIDFERILQTISSQIYDSQFAFLRENVQNAIDAVRIQSRRDDLPPEDSRYRIDVTIAATVCSIQDNGIGMTKAELKNNFWTMGSSGKTTAEAKAAGCIGIFGIGGFANFGVCDVLEVISRTDGSATAHHTSLSRSAFGAERFSLPEVQYRETQELKSRGTIVRGHARAPFDARGLTNYLKEFVRYVRERIYVDGVLISQERMESPRGSYRELTGIAEGEHGGVRIRFELLADDGHNLSVKILGLKIGGQDYQCEGYARLVHGQVAVYRRGFRICSVTIGSRMGVSGNIDCDALQPTAGRDTLDGKSITLLNQIFQIVEGAARPVILKSGDLLANHIRIIPDLLASGFLEQLGLLTVPTLDDRHVTLIEVRRDADQGKRVFYALSNKRTPAAEVLQARGHVIVVVSSNPQRRAAEVEYLKKYCRAEQFEDLIECLDVYSDLDSFERAVLAELDLAIRKLFQASNYKFTPGKLTLDAPIYWSNKRENGATVVLVDTRHGEFQKLRPLGYTALFWSMIEAFCREFLGDTLKRQSPKFFGSGAIDLDAYSKSHAELWELLSSDIEVSTILPTQSPVVGPSRRASRIEVVRSQDIAQVTISEHAGVTVSEAESTAAPHGERKGPAKLLRIVDQTRATGLEGYYLRIPESATAAFGELIRTFPSFAVAWFANRITWQGNDLKGTVFLFDVTLDRLIGLSTEGAISHGALELPPNRLQTYSNQIYFYIPPVIQEYVVPKDDLDSIKIEVEQKLIDLGRPRSWTAKEFKR